MTRTNREVYLFFELLFSAMLFKVMCCLLLHALGAPIVAGAYWPGWECIIMLTSTDRSKGVRIHKIALCLGVRQDLVLQRS